jgi:hypothetical protein
MNLPAASSGYLKMQLPKTTIFFSRVRKITYAGDFLHQYLGYKNKRSLFEKQERL